MIGSNQYDLTIACSCVANDTMQFNIQKALASTCTLTLNVCFTLTFHPFGEVLHFILSYRFYLFVIYTSVRKWMYLHFSLPFFSLKVLEPISHCLVYPKIFSSNINIHVCYCFMRILATWYSIHYIGQISFV